MKREFVMGHLKPNKGNYVIFYVLLKAGLERMPLIQWGSPECLL